MPLPKSNKDLTGVREFISNLQSQFASASTVLGSACSTLFDEVATKLKAVLDGLPKDETAATHAGWALPENWAFEALGSANNLVSGLALEVGRQKQLASAAVLNIGPNVLSDAVTAGTHIPKAAHDAAVTAAVTAATADLVPKASVDQLCSAAKLLGATEGRAALQAELATKAAADKLAAIETFDAASIEAAMRQVAEAVGGKSGPVFTVIRIAVTGKTVTPPLFESIYALGRDQTVSRLRETVALL